MGRLSFVAVALAVLAWLGFSAAWRPFHLPDEARYVGVAWEMMRSSDWLTPTLNDAPFFHKPPLFYWITALAMSALGVSEWPARVAPLLASTATALVLLWFVRFWAGERAARHSLLALLCQPLFFIAAQYANLDMIVAGCISITILLAAHAALVLERGQRAPWVLTAAYGVAALGVLAKGLIGLALPGLVIVVWLLARGQWRVLFKLVWWPGLLLFLAITLPWFVAMHQRYPDFLNYFFVVHHLKRYAAEGFNNVQPWYFYPAVLGLATLPVWPALWRSARPSLWRSDGGSGHVAVRQLMGVWVVSITLFFSMPQSKPLGYILPVLVPLAFLAGDGWAARTPRSRWATWAWWAGLAVSAAASLLAVAYFALDPQKSLRPLGLVLGQHVKPTDQVIALHRFPYDVPLYARLTQPLVVAEHWQDPDVKRSDSWPKELTEARRFLPATAVPLLIAPADLPALLCRNASSWIIASPSEAQRYPWLQKLPLTYADKEAALWRVQRPEALANGKLDCPSIP